ncbi:MAG: DUF3592 domain-containing protein [Candidatus Contendobacter sp.]|jgi:hypothetical protein|nr:DUF3592 domain-containing protein [Gammaproteobacteria bacterium]MCC8995402.1 DUF3592 domain-containing protein [Candidatus Contendobacter sp.]
MTHQLLHPALQKQAAVQRRLLRWLSLLLFLTAASSTLFFTVRAFASGQVADLLLLALMGLILLPIMALLGGLVWYLGRWQTRRFNTANHLLRECTPVMARLTPTGLGAGRNSTLVAIEPLGGKPAAPLYALIQTTFRANRLLRHELTIRWHCRDLKPGSNLVALHEDALLYGQIIDWPTHYRQMRRVMVGAIVAIAVIVVVLATLAVGDYGRYRQFEQELQWAEASRSWSQASGRVERVELITGTVAKGKSQVPAYQAHIEFTYAVADIAQRGDTLYFCNRLADDRPSAEAWLAKYPAGSPVAVHYDPADPARAVLAAGVTTACASAMEEQRLEVILFSVVTGLLLVLGLVMGSEWRKYGQLNAAINRSY